tara:strand:- start:2985 stop:4121 length:1137 start_codon:yes stop_codon:yes gene_type:complete
MIQQYGLNKEKRRKEEDTAMGTLAGMSPQELLQIGQDNPKLGKAIERATTEQATPRDFQLINASAAPIVAGQLRRVKMEGLQTANDLAKLNLGIDKELRDIRVGIGINQGVLSDLATKLAQETDPQKRELLQLELQDRIDNLNQLGQPRRDATKAELELKQKTSKAGAKTLPIRTENIIKEQEVKSKQLDVESELFDILGVSEFAQIKADDLKTLSETNRAKLEQSKAYASYLRNKGLADLVTAANKSSSTFKDRFAPLVEIGGKLLTTNVVVPGSNKRVPFKEYLELNEEDSTKYPMNGMPGDLFAQLQAIEKSQQEVLRDQKVQVNVPDEAIVPTAQKTQAPVPAYKQAIQRMEEKTQQEYMDTPGVGGMGFPFMP